VAANRGGDHYQKEREHGMMAITSLHWSRSGGWAYDRNTYTIPLLRKRAEKMIYSEWRRIRPMVAGRSLMTCPVLAWTQLNIFRS